MNLTKKEIIAKAKEIIIREGWIKGSYYRPGEGYCMMGALRKAAWGSYRFGGSWLDEPANFEEYNQAQVCIETKAIGGVTIAWFNDKPTTTKEDVIAAFDKALEASC